VADSLKSFLKFFSNFQKMFLGESVDNQHHLVFPPFRLDPMNEQLWREGEEILLRRKTFEVLRYLVEHPGRLVTKTALLDAVWTEIAVSDSLPAVSVGELRKALGDEPKTPQFIETVHGRGYRFIAKVTTAAPPALTQPISVPSGPAPIVVGRDAELARVRSWYAEMLAARRQVLFVAGEAGIGKTTFVRAFLEPIDKENKTQIGRGQCIEQSGSGEPYMPILEVLTRVAHRSGGKTVDLLKKFAPSWIVQLPALLTADERRQLQSEAQGVTQQRMLREMAQALEALAAESPLVLVLEDLHWSDFSTLELIAAIARRTEPSRLMVVGTYRPVEVLATAHPLRTLKAELELHRQCNELRLKLLSEEDVAAYLAKRFVDDETRQSLDSVAPVIHARTEGNPLFMVNVVDYLVEQGSLLDALKIDAPHAIQQMIERNLERLHPGEQRTLEVASVVGAEFSAAAVAAALERPLGEVEDCCVRLARHEQFVGAGGVATWPDGTTASRFRFHHALYADVLYDRIAASHRVELHRRIAKRQEAAYGEHANEIAAALAHHYSHTDNVSKAVEYLRRAGVQALYRSALADAIISFTTAIELLQKQPQSPDNMRRESRLQLARGAALVPVKGETAPEVERAYARAAELCEQLDDRRRLFLSQVGLWSVYLTRGELPKAYQLAQQLRQRAQNTNDILVVMYGRIALGETQFYMGELPRAREQFEEVIQLYDFERDSKLVGSQNPGVIALSLVASTLWMLGYPDQALKRRDEALALAQALSSPQNLLFALHYIAWLHQWRRESHSVQATAERIIALSTEHGLNQVLPSAIAHRGWALAQDGNSEEGIALIQQSLAMARAYDGLRPYFHWLLAEAFIRADRLNDAVSALKEAASALPKPHQREAEIYRLNGELLLKQSDSNGDEAWNCFQHAIEIARIQSAKSLELRATMSLARLLAKQNRCDEARALLAEIYNWFTEGFDTADLKEAKALIDELSR
jgi:predicted ATPase